MPSARNRSFDQIRCSASNLADRIEHLEQEMLKTDACVMSARFDNLDGRGERLLGIYSAMTIIAETRNASLNREALKAFDREVKAAERILATRWAKKFMVNFDRYQIPA